MLGLDEELLELVPKPVHAVILLFPDTPEIVEMRKGEGPCLPANKGSEVLWIPQVDVGEFVQTQTHAQRD